MKKTAILAAAVASIMAGTAAADVTIYGKSRVQHIMVDDGVTDQNAGSTRFGFKGTEDLGNGMTLGYKLEMGYAHVDGAAPTGRSGGLTLSGDFGTIAGGKWGAPVYTYVEAYHDYGFNAYAYDDQIIGSSTNQVIAYINKIGDIDFTVGFQDRDDGDDDLNDGIHAGLSVPIGPVTLGVAMIDDIPADDGERTDIGVVYSADAFSVGLAMIDDGTDSDMLLTGKFMLSDANTVVVQLSMDDDEDGSDASATSVAFHHAMSKRTTAYIEMRTEADDGPYLNAKGDTVGAQKTTFGINHNF